MENSTTEDPNDKKRKISDIDEVEIQNNIDVVDDVEIAFDEEKKEEPVPKKKSKILGIDDEADESEDEDAEDGNDLEEEEEDTNNYMFDGFVVDDTDGTGRKEKTATSRPKQVLKKLKKGSKVRLDEEDMYLIQENTQEVGQTIQQDIEEDDESEINEINPTVVNESDNENEDEARSNKRMQSKKFLKDGDEDSIGSFIDRGEEEEDDDEDVRNYSGGFKEPLHGANRALGSSKIDGPTQDQLRDAFAIFGEYDFDEEFDEDEDEDEDESDHLKLENLEGNDLEAEEESGKFGKSKLSAKDKKNIEKLRSRFDRAQLVANFCTERDDEIRRIDRPERLQSILVGRPTLNNEERLIEAEWMASKLSEKMMYDLPIEQLREMNMTGHVLEKELTGVIQQVLKFFQVDQYEVPFIWTYRRDYIHPYMTRDHLWFLFDHDEQWDYLEDLRNKLTLEIQAVNDASKAAREQDEIAKNSIQERVDDLSRSIKAVRVDIEDARGYEERLQGEMALKKEEGIEITAEDKDTLNQANESLESMKIKLQQLELSLRKELQAANHLKQRISKMGMYNSELAKEVIRLFPVERYLPIIASSKEKKELQDITQFFGLLLKGGSLDATKPQESSQSTNKENRIENVELDASLDKTFSLSEGSLEFGGKGLERDLDQLPESMAYTTEQIESSQTIKITSSTIEEPVSSQLPLQNQVNNSSRLLTKNDQYAKFRRAQGIRKFVEMISLPMWEFGDSFRHGFKREPPPTPLLTCTETATTFMDGKILKSIKEVLNAATIITATELSFEPSVRSQARLTFKSNATVSTKPTAKGLQVINPYHEYFGLHYLEKKPLNDFYGLKGYTAAENIQSKILFVKLVEAEKLGLIQISIDPPKQYDPSIHAERNNITPFLLPLAQKFLPTLHMNSDPYPESRISWDDLRMKVLQYCIESIYFPSFAAEFRRDLIRIGRLAIIEEAALNFEKMLSVGPFRPPMNDTREDIKRLLLSCPDKPYSPTVACIYSSLNSNEPLYIVFVDRDGTLKANDVIPSKLINQKQAKLKKFIMDKRPDVIVLNSSGGQVTRALQTLLEKEIISEIVTEIDQKINEMGDGYDRYGARTRIKNEDNDLDDDEFLQHYKPQLIIVKDDISNIYRASVRAKTAFPDLDPACAAAICLARFIQEPLCEYCSLWTSANATELFGYEALFLDVHPNKALLRGVKIPFLRALEHKLVDAVCEVGVDINRAITLDQVYPMLAFVGGLGLRKADALKQNIRKSTGRIEMRIQLLEKGFMGKIVYNNSCGFLRISDNDNMPLENSRIHPECYITHEFAQKMCADALDQQNNPDHRRDPIDILMKSSRKALEDVINECPKWLDLWENGRPKYYAKFQEFIRRKDKKIKIEAELNDKLFLLDLDGYAVDLEKDPLIGKRRLQFDQIKEELRYPWLDLRKPLKSLTAKDMFGILTGESDLSLYVGLKLGGVVTHVLGPQNLTPKQIRECRQRANIRTENGLRGNISMLDVLDEDIKDDFNQFDITQYLQVGMHIQAVVIAVHKDNLTVDLSMKPSYLKTNEAWWIRNRCVVEAARNWWEQLGKKPEALFDQRFNEEEALKQYDAIENEATTNAAMSMVTKNFVREAKPGEMDNYLNQSRNDPSSSSGRLRSINHPLYANLDFRASEERLKSQRQGPGQIIVRPSSKGRDYLSITWAFLADCFKHITVREEGRRQGNLGLGDELFIMEDDIEGKAFSDIDEIYSTYIVPMNDHVSAMMKQKYFHSGTAEEVYQRMKEELDENPRVIPYKVRVDKSRPGYFILTWASLDANGGINVKKDIIHVRPDGYRFRGRLFERPHSLIEFFKQSTWQSISNPKQTGSSSIPSQPVPPRHRVAQVPGMMGKPSLPPPIPPGPHSSSLYSPHRNQMTYINF